MTILIAQCQATWPKRWRACAAGRRWCWAIPWAAKRHTHTHLPYIEAMQAVDLTRVGRRADAHPMLSAAIPEPMLRNFLLQNLTVENGLAEWRINLAALAANMAALLDFPTDLPEPAFEGPAYFLHGGVSPYVPPETHPRIRALFPDAEIEALPGAGHWLHAEQPEAFLGKVEGWLRNVSRG